MKADSHKSKVLEILANENEAVQLPALLAKLGSQFKERTVRRWLNDWVQTGVVIRSGSKRSTHYVAANKRNGHVSANVTFSQPSRNILECINQPFHLRSPVGYHLEWLEKYKPNKDFYLPLSIREELTSAGTRSKHHQPAGTYAKHIYQRLLIDLSYHSSRLEGNTYSLLDTKILLIEGVEAPGKLTEEKTMILNHKEAIRFLVENPGNLMVTEDTIFTLHFLLSDALVVPQYAGKVRDYGVRISGSTYVPMENPTVLKSSLKKICQKAAQIKNPHEQSIFLLAHLSYLQAFVDVNKRTARLASNIPLIKGNLVPLSFNDMPRDSYMNAMIAIYELNDIRPLVDLYVHSYKKTCELYDVTVEAISFNPLRVQYRQLRRDVIRHIVTQQMKAKRAEKYIELTVTQLVQERDRAIVISDIQEDLSLLGPNNIAGLGISGDEFRSWQKL